METWEPHDAGQALACQGWGHAVTAVRAQEPGEIAARLLRQYPDHLGPARLARIGWCYTSKELRVNGRTCYAKTTLHSPAARAKMAVFGEVATDTQPDFIVEVNLECWLDLSEPQQRALVHHELCHIDTRDGKWCLRGHTVEEFAEVIKAHGLWDWGAQEAGRAIQAHLPGLEDAETAALSLTYGGKTVTTTPENLQRLASMTPEEMGDLVDQIPAPGPQEAA